MIFLGQRSQLFSHKSRNLPLLSWYLYSFSPDLLYSPFSLPVDFLLYLSWLCPYKRQMPHIMATSTHFTSRQISILFQILLYCFFYVIYLEFPEKGIWLAQVTFLKQASGSGINICKPWFLLGQLFSLSSNQLWLEAWSHVAFKTWMLPFGRCRRGSTPEKVQLQ